ncbi:MAG: Hpt domain-containing protein [Phycisphaeraceae bacterium]|nr:Hpt domain-containing protein [Phycisphaeraceae bacterium]MCW5753390.1 Hpt domain-containing protein [Phycisphaeraceae bacterium]
MTPPPSSGGSSEKPITSTYHDDPEMGEIIRDFVAELPQRIHAMRSAFSEQRLLDLLHLAHQLKGAGGGYGFDQISAAAARLELALKSLQTDRAADAAERAKVAIDEVTSLCRRATA